MTEHKLTKEMIGMEKISPSQLMCYTDCPKLFYYKEWLGLKIDQHQRHFAFGNAYHSAIESIYTQYDDNFKGGWTYADPSIARDVFRAKFTIDKITDQEFEEVYQMKSNKYKSKSDMFDAMLKDGLSMVSHYWNNKEYLLTEYGVDIVETEIAMKIEMKNPADETESLPIPLSLRMDALTRGRKIIVENKTSGALYNEDDTRRKLQGKSYCFAYLMKYHYLPESVTYLVSIKNREDGDKKIQVIVIKYDMADMIEYFQEVKMILQKIANREFDYGKVGPMSRLELKKYEEALGL